MCIGHSGSARHGNHKKRSPYLKIELISRLGDGAFADVWKAKDELDRDVAVKIVRASGVVMASATAVEMSWASATMGDHDAAFTVWRTSRTMLRIG